MSDCLWTHEINGTPSGGGFTEGLRGREAQVLPESLTASSRGKLLGTGRPRPTVDAGAKKRWPEDAGSCHMQHLQARIGISGASPTACGTGHSQDSLDS